VDRERADELADGGALDRRGNGRAGDLVDLEQPDRDAGAVLQIAFLEPHRGPHADIAQRGLEEIAHPGIGSEPVGHDCNQTAAGLQSAKGCLEMSDSGVCVRAQPDRPGEWRVHEDQAGARRCRQARVDRGAVVASDGRVGEDIGETRPAARRIFVELEGAEVAAMRHEEPIAGARLEDHIVALDIGEDNRHRGKIDGRRELLPFDLIFAANGLGGQPVEQVAGRNHVIERGQRIGTELEVVGERMLENLEAVALGPEPVRVGPAIAFDHRRIEVGPGDRVRRPEAVDEKRGRAAFGRGGGIEEIGHGGVSGLAAPSAASILRSPFPLPSRAVVGRGRLRYRGKPWVRRQFPNQCYRASRPSWRTQCSQCFRCPPPFSTPPMIE
jgi:hypothetical protein